MIILIKKDEIFIIVFDFIKYNLKGFGIMAGGKSLWQHFYGLSYVYLLYWNQLYR